jgi:hypothetical protein
MILTATRFTDGTFKDTQHFMATRPEITTIYVSSRELNPKFVSINQQLCVVEMNITEDKIEGIGKIRNNPRYDKRRRLTRVDNYNRTVYI